MMVDSGTPLEVRCVMVVIDDSCTAVHDALRISALLIYSGARWMTHHPLPLDHFPRPNSRLIAPTITSLLGFKGAFNGTTSSLRTEDLISGNKSNIQRVYIAYRYFLHFN